MFELYHESSRLLIDFYANLTAKASAVNVAIAADEALLAQLAAQQQQVRNVFVETNCRLLCVFKRGDLISSER